MKKTILITILALLGIVGQGQTIRPAVKASTFDNLTGTSNSSTITIGDKTISLFDVNSLQTNGNFYVPAGNYVGSQSTSGLNPFSVFSFYNGYIQSLYKTTGGSTEELYFGNKGSSWTISPATNSNTWDLGTSTLKFKDGYFAGTVYVKEVVPEAYQGVAWNESADSYVRLGTLQGIATGISPGNGNLPIQSKMRGCVLHPNGTVNYYLADYDWSYKADGTTSTLTGADGNVMVEIPAFYYKYAKVGNWNTMCISLYPLSGYSLHPAFTKDGVNVAYRYIGAYEAVLIHSGSPVDYWSGSTQPNTSTDKLGSVSGYRPVTNYTRAGGRAMAARVGTGWRQQDADLVHAVQLLMLVEYGTFYIQNIAEVGPGITNVGDWSGHNNYYPFAPTGNGNSIGNVSGDNAGSSTCTADSMHYSRYRGIENFYGHIWKWVDGININDHVPYVTNNASVWADDTSTGYTDLGVTLAGSDGWGLTLSNTARLFAPATVGGGSTTYITDYYYQNPGWRVAFLGGTADNGANAGPWCWSLYYGSGVSYQGFGSRLAF